MQSEVEGVRVETRSWDRCESIVHLSEQSRWLGGEGSERALDSGYISQVEPVKPAERAAAVFEEEVPAECFPAWDLCVGGKSLCLF